MKKTIGEMMKSEITEEERQDLSSKEQQELVDWLELHGYNRDNPLMMDHLIAFLDDHIEEGWWCLEREGHKLFWRINTKNAVCGGNVYIHEEEYEEAIDALWGATVKILEYETR